MSHNNDIISKTVLVKKFDNENEGEYTGCWFPDFEPIPKEDLISYQKQHPFVPTVYLEFLEKFSGAEVSWLKILSFNDPERLTINDSLSDLQEYWDYSDGYLPFAEDGGAYIYCFDQDGKVWGFSLEGYGEKPDFFADSFEQFIDECLLGKRYTEFLSAKDNQFYDFLKSQGWV